ncbi:hypothetical protein N9955_00020 [bacterium]|nr:hypothetical protein [bacterium]
MKPLIVMVAVNEPYESQAREFVKSAQADVLIVTRDMLGSELSDGLRREKADFASFIPSNHEGSVILIDADSVVTGEVSTPFSPPKGTVAGIEIYKGKTLHHPEGILPPKSGVYLDTLCLYFHDLEDAKTVSGYWVAKYDELTSHKTPFVRDMWGFNFCSHLFNTMAAPEVTYSQPIKGVEHLFTETASLPKNIYTTNAKVSTK